MPPTDLTRIIGDAILEYHTPIDAPDPEIWANQRAAGIAKETGHRVQAAVPAPRLSQLPRRGQVTETPRPPALNLDTGPYPADTAQGRSPTPTGSLPP